MPSSRPTNLLVLLGLALYLVFLAWDGLTNPRIEGLDGAHHVMDGVFFRDFLLDLPFDRLGSYPYDYYAQYPSLGFIFWPPLFPFVEGVFFLVAGEINLFVAQLSILFYALVGLCAGFHLLKPRLGTGLTALALVSLFGISEFVRYQNQVRLEIPMIAMGLWCLALYQSLMTRERPEWWRLVLFSAVGAGMLYTKQVAFTILVAIALDLVVNHRARLKDKRLLASGALLLLLLVPLALFTLKYGKSNIAQSLGSGTSTIMEGYVGSARFSLESWLFYPRGLWQVLDPATLLLAAWGLVLFVLRRDFRRQNLLWVAWIGCFYLAFSYFDNRTLRFAMQLYPPLIFLAIQALRAILQSEGLAAKRGLITGFLILASGGLGARNALAHEQAGFGGLEALMAPLEVHRMDGNLAYQGRYRQLFVFHFRKQDFRREHYFLQADDILPAEAELVPQLHKYRVRLVFVESTEVELIQRLNAVPEGIQSMGTFVLSSPGKELKLTIFEFTGELAETMTKPPLESKLL